MCKYMREDSGCQSYVFVVQCSQIARDESSFMSFPTPGFYCTHLDRLPVQDVRGYLIGLQLRQSAAVDCVELMMVL
jgi:hypothetical protein